MSPVATLDDDTARAALLAAADVVFYARGLGGTGMAEIRDASGVSLRRLYGLYPSKQDLAAGWLEARHRTWMEWFADGIEVRTSSGVRVIDAVFDTLADWASTPGYRGCAFVNTAAEVAEIDERHLRIIASHKRALVEFLTGLMRDAGIADPEDVGKAVGVLVDGAIVQAAVFGSLGPIDSARAVARRLVG